MQAVQLKVLRSIGMMIGAIVGVGSFQGLGAVRWVIASRIVWAWIATVPAAALIAALTYFFTHAISIFLI